MYSMIKKQHLRFIIFIVNTMRYSFNSIQAINSHRTQNTLFWDYQVHSSR